MNQVEMFLQPYADKGARLVDDSRQIRKEDVFVAVPGSCTDGRRHVSAAVENGAAAVLWEQDGVDFETQLGVPQLGVRNLTAQLGQIASAYYGNPSAEIKVIAITGTNGKTTTAQWCGQLLNGAGVKAGYIGTLGAGVAGEQLAPAQLTTPGVLELNGTLASMVEQGCQAVVLEASSHGLEQNRLAGVECDYAVFTNLGQDHLDHHKDEDSYLRSKMLLFERPELAGAVVNDDDPLAGSFADATSVAALRCGQGPGCDVRWSVEGHGEQGVQGRIEHRDGSFSFVLAVPGSHNVANAAMAASAAWLAGVPWEELSGLLPQLKPVPGRMERVGTGMPFAYVDYAHTPDALETALQCMRDTHPGRYLTCVFGCGGNRDRGKRPLMGEIASNLADLVVITSDNPRDEDPAAIAAEILAGVNGAADVILDRGAAIKHAIAHAGEDGVLLVAGKGAESHVEVAGGELLAFSDAATLERELAGA